MASHCHYQPNSQQKFVCRHTGGPTAVSEHATQQDCQRSCRWHFEDPEGETCRHFPSPGGRAYTGREACLQQVVSKVDSPVVAGFDRVPGVDRVAMDPRDARRVRTHARAQPHTRPADDPLMDQVLEDAAEALLMHATKAPSVAEAQRRRQRVESLKHHRDPREWAAALRQASLAGYAETIEELL